MPLITNSCPSECCVYFSGFEDQFFERPRFPHPPIGERRPRLLSPPDTTPTVQIPAVINQYLRGYQREGVAFLYNCYRSNAGGMLCDDMGLGKTVQVGRMGWGQGGEVPFIIGKIPWDTGLMV